MAAPSPIMNPSRCPSNGLHAVGDKRAEDNEAQHAKGMNHAVMSANDRHIGVPSTDRSQSFCNRLCRSSTRREAGSARSLYSDTLGDGAGHANGVVPPWRGAIRRESARSVARSNPFPSANRCGYASSSGSLDALEAPCRERQKHGRLRARLHPR